MTNSCKGCNVRAINCHNGCDKYAEFRAELAAANESYRNRYCHSADILLAEGSSRAAINHFRRYKNG